jgi:hypothetical protein
MWMALGAGALLLVAVVAVVVYKASGGVNENGNGGTEDAYASPTPAGRASGAQSDTNVPTPAPTPATTSPSNPTPTSAASPRPTPPHNLNVRPPINSVVGPVNSAPAEVPDSVIQMHVDKRIAGHAQDLSDVEGEVSNGVVTLTGSVRSADWKTTVEMQIRGITGVKKVVNRIKVQ